MGREDPKRSPCPAKSGKHSTVPPTKTLICLSPSHARVSFNSLFEPCSRKSTFFDGKIPFVIVIGNFQLVSPNLKWRFGTVRILWVYLLGFVERAIEGWVTVRRSLRWIKVEHYIYMYADRLLEDQFKGELRHFLFLKKKEERGRRRECSETLSRAWSMI